MAPLGADGIKSVSRFRGPKLVFGGYVSPGLQIGKGVVAIRIRGGCLDNRIRIGLQGINLRPGESIAFEGDGAGNTGNARPRTGVGQTCILRIRHRKRLT